MADPEINPVRRAAPVEVSPGALEGMGASYAQNKPTASTSTSGTKEKLQAIANGGAAGLKNYQASQDFLQSQRQMALTRAADRSKLIGGPESQGFESFTEGEFARRSADIAQAGAAQSRAGSMRQGAIANYRKSLQAGIPLAMAAGAARGKATAAEKAGKEDFVSRALGQAELDEQAAAGNLAKGQGDVDTLNKERTQLDFNINQADSALKSVRERRAKLDKEWRQADAPNIATQVAGKTNLGKGRSKKDIEAELASTAMTQHRLVKNIDRMKAELGEWDRTKGETIKTRQKEMEGQQSFTPETRADRAREIAIRQMNVDPALAMGKIGSEDVKSRLPKPAVADEFIMGKAKVTQPELKTIKGTEEYNEYAPLLNDLVSAWSKEQALQYINTVSDPKVRAVLRAEYEDQFLTAAQRKSASGKK